MSEYTQKEIDDLIQCRKKIHVPPRKSLIHRDRSYRNDMQVIDSTKRRFKVFMRVNEFFPECFSVGLIFVPTGSKELMLLRCNGPHGGHAKMQTTTDTHYQFHIHRATEDALELKQLSIKDATVTTEYNSFRSALRFFLRETNIAWSNEDFPDLQETLFDGLGDEE